MANSTLESLLSAVRRRIWRAELFAAARLALWGSAALLVLAAAAHVALGPVPLAVVPTAIVVLSASMLARAAWRRPSDSACALWADRHLGGASAFTTWLEMRSVAPPAAQAQALAWLEQWTSARVPHSLRLLEARRDPAQLARPLLSALVCAAFAALVLTLPGFFPSSRPAAPSASSIVEGSALEKPPPTAGLVGELADALRAAESRPAPDRHAAGAAPPPGRGSSEDGHELTIARLDAATSAERATNAKPTAQRTSDAAPATGPTVGSGAGRAAGESLDRRAESGSAPAPRSTMPAERREPAARRLPPEQQADMAQAAKFDEDVPVQPTARRRADAPAAATPPAATDTAELTSSQAAYVQAWMKANGRRR